MRTQLLSSRAGYNPPTRMKKRGRTFVVVGIVLPSLTFLLHAQARPLSNASPDEIAAGKRIFAAQCAWCHGTDGVGGSGPSLQRATLRHARQDTDLVAIVRTGIPGTEMPGSQLSMTETMAWRTAAYVRSLGRASREVIRGDAQRGAAVYEAKGCQTCHVLNGRGTAVGPELTRIGALRGATYLREAMVKPEAARPPGYLVVRASTRAGTELRGIRVDEDVFWIHVRDAAGKVHALEKKHLVQLDRELTATLMPSYASLLTADELDDLVAYLSSRQDER
jgi:cytochrome c oxidase cbb3-type subunit III